MESNTSGTAYRVGGVYRDKHGMLYALAPLASGDEFYRKYHPNDAIASSYKVGHDTGKRYGDSCGAHRLSDGAFLAVAGSDWDLLPGELHQVSGEWVPVEAPAAAEQESFDAVFDAFFGIKPTVAPAPTIPFERPRTQREAQWMLRQAMAKDVAEAAAREAEARRSAPPPACAGLLRLAPMR